MWVPHIPVTETTMDLPLPCQPFLEAIQVTVEAQNNGVYNDLSGPRTYTFASPALRRFFGGSHAVLVGTNQNYLFFRSGNYL